jgi:hypothetical protein
MPAGDSLARVGRDESQFACPEIETEDDMVQQKILEWGLS